MRFFRRLLSFALLAFSIVSIDAAVKFYTERYLPLMLHGSSYPYGGIPVFHQFHGINFSINHATNTGAAWGMFSNFQKTLFSLRLLLITALLIYSLFFSMGKLRRLAFNFILGGALGNVLDFLFYGHVIDMFHFSFFGYHFPVFNLADSFIFFGVCYLFCEGFFLSPKKKALQKSESKIPPAPAP